MSQQVDTTCNADNNTCNVDKYKNTFLLFFIVWWSWLNTQFIIILIIVVIILVFFIYPVTGMMLRNGRTIYIRLLWEYHAAQRENVTTNSRCRATRYARLNKWLMRYILTLRFSSLIPSHRMVTTLNSKVKLVT